MAYELWCWLVEEEDGREGTIAAIIPDAGMLQPLVLQSSTRELAAEVIGDIGDEP